MNLIRKLLSRNPVLPRLGPFVLFLVLTSLQGQFGEESRYWLYLAKTILGAWMIWVVRPLIAEMRWAFSWEAVVVGIVVFALWVGLDGLYPSINQLFGSQDSGKSWNPNTEFREGSGLAILFIAVRIAGSALVVPPLEEVFYRSLVYRWIVRPDFLSVGFKEFNLKAFLVTSVIFGLVHQEWLAGILCGMAFQYLVIRKGRLGDAITAHAITNLLLGIWVVWRGAWNFW